MIPIIVNIKQNAIVNSFAIAIFISSIIFILWSVYFTILAIFAGGIQGFPHESVGVIVIQKNLILTNIVPVVQ
jgi:hypothetical protein